MSSPPSTPPSALPLDREEYRFIWISEVTEWVERYRPGRFHPVNLGDTFQDGKYRVIRKLGFGSFSTVWLAVSTSTPRYVALKIMDASVGSSATELSMLQYLSTKADGDPHSRHVPVLLEEFQHKGPNGKHQCLVFEPMGATAESLVEQLPENKFCTSLRAPTYPKWIVRKILTHALRGLAFLHRNGVIHGDVQPGNLLFSIDNMDGVEEKELLQDEASTGTSVQRKDGKTDLWAPKYLFPEQSLHDRVKVNSELTIKLSDLGSSFWAANPPTEHLSPIALRAPEMIHKQELGTGIDIWALGCLMFEFLTSRRLFCIMLSGHDSESLEDADDDHLYQMNEIIGPLPDDILDAWDGYGCYYGPDGEPINPYDGEPREKRESLEVFFKNYKNPEIDKEEAVVVLSLLRKILVYDPKMRPSAEELLKHPWFSD